jgi:hypothetical protein
MCNNQTVEEISRVSGLTESNTKVKLHRARKQLYTLLNDMLKEDLYTILSLFVVLVGAMIWVSGSQPVAESTPGFLPEMNTDTVLTGYRAFFDKLGALPASIAGIFLASSLLIFLEKLVDSRRHAMQ